MTPKRRVPRSRRWIFLSLNRDRLSHKNSLVLEIVASDARVSRLPIWDFAMRAVAAIVLAFWAALFFNGLAFAEKRVALVIGNSAYQNVSRLANPGNDSAAISATFKSASFDVVELKRDLNVSEMRRTSTDGMAVLPFRSALLGAVRDTLHKADHLRAVCVQPVSVRYSGPNRRTCASRPRVLAQQGCLA